VQKERQFLWWVWKKTQGAFLFDKILLFILKKSASFAERDIRGAHEKLNPIVCFNDYRIMWHYRDCELQSS
jgi:hypothetical protein